MARDLFGRNPDKLAELIQLRTAGWPYLKLGRHFARDHSTIIYNLRRFAPHLVGGHIATRLHRLTIQEMRRNHRRLMSVTVVGPTTLYVHLLEAPKPHPSMKYKHLVDDECVKVNPGKSYRQYRKESRARYAKERAERMERLKKEMAQRIKARGKLSGHREGGFNSNGWW